MYGVILVTGASGLIGRHTSRYLNRMGYSVRPFDLRRSPEENVCDTNAVEQALAGVDGVIHLAAISRVIDGERDPVRCRSTNIDGMGIVLDAAIRALGIKPWFIFASSREVYGNAAIYPTPEDADFDPLNTYAHTKVTGERLIGEAREKGLIANICRLSTVYGSTHDYADRVLPAFCRAAANGGDVHVEGPDVVLDPTHIDDVTSGLGRLAQRTAAGDLLPPIHLVGGHGYSLMELAELAICAGDPATRIAVRPPRKFDVSRFMGDPGRAKALLDWTTQTSVEDGVRRLVKDFRALQGARSDAVPARGFATM